MNSADARRSLAAHKQRRRPHKSPSVNRRCDAKNPVAVSVHPIRITYKCAVCHNCTVSYFASSGIIPGMISRTSVTYSYLGTVYLPARISDLAISPVVVKAETAFRCRMRDKSIAMHARMHHIDASVF